MAMVPLRQSISSHLRSISLADPEPVQERHQRNHVVAVAMTVALQRRKQPVELVLGERLALAAIGLASLDFPLYSSDRPP